MPSAFHEAAKWQPVWTIDKFHTKDTEDLEHIVEYRNPNDETWLFRSRVLKGQLEVKDYLGWLKNQGVDPKRRYWHTVVGYNYRMTNVQAAIGLAQLEKLEWHLGERRRVAASYEQHLEPLGKSIDLPQAKSWGTHCFWMYVVGLKPGVRKNRDEVAAQLAEAGIETRPAFYPLHHLPPYEDRSLKLPVTESIAARALCRLAGGQTTREVSAPLPERARGRPARGPFTGPSRRACSAQPTGPARRRRPCARPLPG